MEHNKKILSALIFTCALIVGCSSSSTSDTSGNTSNPNTPPGSGAEKNVAAASNGATVSSTFAGNETFTTDDDTTTVNFWQGGTESDEVKITFDKSYSISEIKLHTNNRSVSISEGVASTGFQVFISNDDVIYSEVAMYFGVSAAITCFSNILSNTNGTVECVLANNQDVQYIRVRVLSDFDTTELYEIEVTGI